MKSKHRSSSSDKNLTSKLRYGVIVKNIPDLEGSTKTE